IIKEMAGQLGFAKIFMFIKEDSAQSSWAYVHTTLPINLSMIFSAYGPQTTSSQSVKFSIPAPVTDAETQLVSLLQSQIEKFQPAM
ncbi:MAG: hypothetical protein KW804_02985, partial [Candidatus Doudnabacteria bacterium]|nr:hypothetical protein [Candidatus Doudnabacteria bacterium]